MSLHDIKDREPNRATVELLEAALEQAKNGELRSFVMVKSWDDNSTSYHWSLDNRTHRKPILGELVLLQNDLAINTGLEHGDSVLAGCFLESE